MYLKVKRFYKIRGLFRLNLGTFLIKIGPF
nr:MAG TPA: hypothetical protein [Caudoviricetes sp.]